MFARWELRFLEDPRGVYAKTENIHTVVRPGFVEDYPDAAEFLRNFRLSAAQLQGLMDRMRDPNADPEQIARRWVEGHAQVVDSWLPGIRPAPPS
jgi:glycine betaine/proline transport system substrate-binding protein